MNWQEIVKQKNLSVSIINLKQLNLATRIDAEHYQQHFLDNLDAVKKKNNKRLAELVTKSITTGHTPSMKDESYYGGDTKFIKTDNLRDNVINEDFNHFLSDKGAQKLKNALLRPNDVIVTIIGANYSVVGRVARVFEDLGKSAINQNISLIRPKIKSGYLTTFLTGQYGKQQLYYLSRQTEQVNLNNVEVADVIVPIPSNDFENKIHNIHTETHELQIKAKSSYSQAEDLLLAELGLVDYVPSEANTSIRNLFECLQENRFDAEYWMPKYDEIIDRVRSYKKGFSTIGKEFKQLKNNFKRQINKDYNYIEIGDVNVSTGEVEYTTVLGKELPANAKIKFEKKQLITSKVRPNRGATAILNSHEGFIGSGAFTVLTESGNINLESLMVYLKTQPIRDLLLKYNTGTSYPVIIDSDILNLPIPLVDKSIQNKIAELVSNASKARKQSKRLLEKAKRGVEIFIEQDETKALEYLES